MKTERQKRVNATIRRELKWVLGFFFVPMLLLIGFDLAFSNSPLPLWKRVMTLEDTCSYGMCFILPAVLFFLVVGVRLFVAAVQRRRETGE